MKPAARQIARNILAAALRADAGNLVWMNRLRQAATLGAYQEIARLAHCEYQAALAEDREARRLRWKKWSQGEDNVSPRALWNWIKKGPRVTTLPPPSQDPKKSPMHFRIDQVAAAWAGYWGTPGDEEPPVLAEPSGAAAYSKLEPMPDLPHWSADLVATLVAQAPDTAPGADGRKAPEIKDWHPALFGRLAEFLPAG